MEPECSKFPSIKTVPITLERGTEHRAGLPVICNPPDNSVLQGRFDHCPIRRGLTRVKELLAASVNVAGHDSVMNPWYPMGKDDPMHTAFVLLHYALMSGARDRAHLFPMLSSRPAAIWNNQAVKFEPGKLEAGAWSGLGGHGIRVGNDADLIVWPVPTDAPLCPQTWQDRGGNQT